MYLCVQVVTQTTNYKHHIIMFKHLKQTFIRVCLAFVAIAALNVAAPSLTFAQEASGETVRKVADGYILGKYK